MALGVVGFDPNAQNTPLVALDVQSPRSEAFRSIRTNLQYVDVDNPPHVLAITSALPAEGKTTTACNLAIALAQAGKSVCLVDADLRRPKVANYLGIEPTYGLTNVTTAACNATIIGAITGGLVTDGSSLFCNASPAAQFTAPPPAGAGFPNSLNGLTPGASASTYLFADSVHPTTAVHKIFADQVWLKLKDFGWVPDNL